MKRALLFLVLAACGRVNFDPIDGFDQVDGTRCLFDHPSLVACWPFDGTDDEVHRDAATSALNVDYVSGLEGQALHLSSASRVIIGEAEDFDVGSYTIMAWFRAELLPAAGERGVVFDNNTQYAFYLYDQGLGCTGGGVHELPITFNVGTWHHVACVNTGPIKRLYVDGARIGEVATPGPVTTSGTEGSRIGGNIPDSRPEGDYLLGDIDDVQFFNIGLTDAEICAASGAC